MSAWIGPAITGGATILSALMGDSSGSNDAAILNYYEQQRANRAREALAREQFNLSKSPVISASGSRYGYDPVVGAFVTDLSPQDELLRVLQQNALAEQLGEGNAQAIAQRNNAFDRSMDANSLVESLFRRYNDPPPFTADEAYGSALSRHHRETNRLFDRGMEQVLGNMAARGESPTGAIMRAISERSAALSQNAPSRFDARVDAYNLNDSVQNSRLNRIGAGLGMMQNPGVSAPNLPGINDAANTLANSRSAAVSGGANAMQGIGSPQLSGWSADNTGALRIGAIGNAVGGIFEALANRNNTGPGGSFSLDRQRGNVQVDNNSGIPSGTYSASKLAF